MNTKEKLKKKCDDVKQLLLKKNEAYGDSALIPANIFSHLTAVEAIKIRIDDKLKRIENKGIYDNTEDTLMDLAGYLVLLMVAKDNESNSIQGHKRHKQPISLDFNDSPTSHTGGKIKVTYQED
tara:strand:+ start:19 stop:390 length:372 start_codon:yes stop_codon:yes gene_type:complete